MPNENDGQLKFLVVMPCYNPGGEFLGVVNKILGAGKDLLLIDDGSNLQTKSEIHGLNLEKLIVHNRNLGKGAAIKAALLYAAANRCSHIVTIDADGQHDPQEIVLLENAAKKDPQAIIIGAREMGKVDSHGNPVPKSSRFGRQFSNFWLWVETGHWLPDTQSGFRVYPVEKTLKLPLYKDRFDFEIEVLAKAGQAGIAILSEAISVTYFQGIARVSHFNKFKDNWRLTIVHSQLVLRRLIKATLG